MNAAARARGLAATLAIVGILVGLPWVLVHLGGGTLPRSIDLGEVWRVLTSRDDGTVAVTVIKLVAWVVWGLLAVTLLVEILAQARHIDPPRLRGFGVPQGAARGLVATAALLFIAGGQIGHVLAAHAAPTAGPAAPATPTAAAVRTPSATVATSTIEGRRYTVKAGDTLWQIATTHLGSGQRYTDIVTLNSDLLGGKPDFLRPGWVLTLPADVDADTVTVQAGDTLSSIARTHFDGDETAYRQIFDASRDLTQPDGRHLTNPDLIYPGWHLHLTPGASTSATTPAATPARVPGEVAPTTPATASATSGVAQTTSPATRTAPGTGAEAAPDPATATGQPTPNTPSTGAPATSGQQPAPTGEEGEVVAPWLLIGLTGAGALLAGSMLRVLRQRRRTQLRSRRPGRAIPAPPGAIIPVEQTLIHVGTATLPTVETLDRVLRALARTEADAGRPVPVLAAVELSPGRLMVHLAVPADLPAPWHGDPAGLHWHLTASDLTAIATHPTDPDVCAPYPQLVTIGAKADGTAWLLNAEEFGALTLTGDPTFALDFARYLIAEFAVNAWSRDVRVDCLGMCPELIPLNPDRIRHHAAGQVLDDVLDDVRHTADRLTDHAEATVVDARVHGAGDDLWGSRVVFTDLADDPQLRALQDLVEADPRRAATSIFLLHPESDAAPIRTSGVEIRLTADGRALLPAIGLELVAVGLTADEAAGCAALIDACDNLDDEPIPATPPTGDETLMVSNEAGQLLPDLTLPRLPDGDDDETDAHSVLPDPDEDYLAVSATTSEDLTTLAPRVPAEIRTLVEKTESTLDADVDAWFAADCDLPRLTLLGPVEVRLGEGGHPAARRKAYYIELAAFLGVHPNGVTADQIATAMGIPVDRVRKDTSVLRDWLGKNPRTGEPHLPESTRSRATRERGINAYQLDDVLVDADLFKRLRTRGETRGADGIADLRTALRLVAGRPFDQLRVRGGTWLTADTRYDHYLACGIVDVAHLVAIDALHQHDYYTARAAAEIASQAAPYDEIPQLDLAAIAAGEGRFHEADRILRAEITNRTDDDTAPTDPSERAVAIVGTRTWLNPDRAAS